MKNMRKLWRGIARKRMEQDKRLKHFNRKGYNPVSKKHDTKVIPAYKSYFSMFWKNWCYPEKKREIEK
jgi:hypothetical protein